MLDDSMTQVPANKTKEYAGWYKLAFPHLSAYAYYENHFACYPSDASEYYIGCDCGNLEEDAKLDASIFGNDVTVPSGAREMME